MFKMASYHCLQNFVFLAAEQVGEIVLIRIGSFLLAPGPVYYISIRGGGGLQMLTHAGPGAQGWRSGVNGSRDCSPKNCHFTKVGIGFLHTKKVVTTGWKHQV